MTSTDFVHDIDWLRPWHRLTSSMTSTDFVHGSFRCAAPSFCNSLWERTRKPFSGSFKISAQNFCLTWLYPDCRQRLCSYDLWRFGNLIINIIINLQGRIQGAGGPCPPSLVECTKIRHFGIKIQKNFWGGAQPPPQTSPQRHPSTNPTPLPTLDPPLLVYIIMYQGYTRYAYWVYKMSMQLAH